MSEDIPDWIAGLVKHPDRIDNPDMGFEGTAPSPKRRQRVDRGTAVSCEHERRPIEARCRVAGVELSDMQLGAGLVVLGGGRVILSVQAN